MRGGSDGKAEGGCKLGKGMDSWDALRKERAFGGSVGVTDVETTLL